MLPWFASVLLLLSYNFSGLHPADIEIDSRGVIWVLSSIESVVTRLGPLGEVSLFEMDMAGLPSGLAVSPSGRWAVACPWADEIAVFGSDDILLERISTDSPGDLLFKGLDIWVTNTATGSVSILEGPVVARNCAGRNSRLASGRSGNVLITGSKGVFLLSLGETGEALAGQGEACFARESILLLNNGTLVRIPGDTLATGIQGNKLSASPSGEIIVVWGGATPALLE